MMALRFGITHRRWSVSPLWQRAEVLRTLPLDCIIGIGTPNAEFTVTSAISTLFHGFGDGRKVQLLLEIGFGITD